MNTPSPCDVCAHLYADTMNANNPSYTAECKLGLPMGRDCPKFHHWRFSVNKEEPPKFCSCCGKLIDPEAPTSSACMARHGAKDCLCFKEKI